MKPEYLDCIKKQLDWTRWLGTDSAAQMWSELRVVFGERESFEQPLKYGDAVYVGPDFCTLLEHAAASLPDVTLQEEWFPAESGWVWFARPLLLPAVDPSQVKEKMHFVIPENFRLPIQAFGWSRIELADGRRTSITVAAYQPQGLKMGPVDANGQPTLVPRFDGREGFYPLSRFSWIPGQSLDQRIREYERDADSHGQIGLPYKDNTFHEIRYFATLLLMMDQKLLLLNKERIGPRAARKRIAKERPVEHIMVVTLRRYRQDDDGSEADPEPAEWSCRWVVRGHWRQQWYPKTQTHKPKWILPYVKGPEDRPMKDDQRRLFAVVR